MAENNKDTSKCQSGSAKQRTSRRIPGHYSIGVRFISFLLVAVLLSGAGGAAVVLLYSRNYLRQQALNNNLTEVDLAAAFASNYIKAVEAHVLVFALRPDITQAVLDGTTDQLQPTLAQFVQIQTALDSVGIYDAAGIQLATSNANATTIGQSFADREWYQQTMATGQPYLGIPIKSRTTGSFTVPFVVPIKDNGGQIKALLTGGISLAVLSTTITDISFGLNTTAAIIDIRNGGIIIADKNPQLILTPLTDNNAATTLLLTGQRGAVETKSSTGERDLTGFAPVPNLPWGVTVVTPTSSALAILNTLTQKAAIFAGLIILVVAILGVFLVIGITRRLNRLVLETKEIGRGNLDIKVEIGGKDEVGDLSRAFSDMTVKLKNTMVSRDEMALEVAERKKTEELLHQSEDKYRKLFDNAEVGMYRSLLNGAAFLDINNKLCEIFGYTREEMMSNPAAMRWNDPGARLEMIKQLRENNLLTDYEVEIITKSGAVRTLVTSIRLYPKEGYLEGSMIDITERKQAEEKLQETNQYLENLFNYANAPIIVWDRQFRIVRFNHAFEKLTGRNAGDVVGQSITILFPSSLVEASMELIKATTVGDRWETVEISILRQDGSVRTVLWNSASVLANDRKTRVATIAQGQDITERKQSEKSLKESEGRYRTLFESAIDGILIADLATRQFKYANPSMCKMLGYTQEELTKMGVMDIHPPESVEDNIAKFAALARGELKMVTVPCLRKDGTIIIVNISAVQAMLDGVECNIGFFKDVTDSKLAEEILRASESRYRRLFEAARDGILILDVETGTVVDVNPFMVKMLGFSREEFLDKKIWELGFLKDIIANRDNFEELKRKKYITYENLPLETASGQQIEVEFVSNVYDVGNQKVIQCNIRDITIRRRLEIEREKIAKELAEKNSELERFTYTVSHDLKSPLVTVKTFLGYLKHDIVATDQLRIENDMFYMNSAADKMGKLLEELLEMSRVGRISNLPVNVTFDELVEDTLSITAGRIEEKGVQVRLHKEPVMLFGDRTRLVEIWQNLVENAVKFLGDQPAPQIDIGVGHQELETVFFVRDNGIGIEPQYQRKLFNLFEKLNPKMEGTGMGLAITKRIVELYQGKIWVESKGLGQGTTFFFTLPGALKDKKKGVLV